MSDQALRELERGHQADPSDRVALERLQDERVRRGLGWHGETMRAEEMGVLVTSPQRGVYQWWPSAPDRGPGEYYVELVYVPGGEVECERCRGQGGWFEADLRRYEETAGRRECQPCNGTGKRKVAPFYLGRFPVTFDQKAHAEHDARGFSVVASSASLERGSTAPVVDCAACVTETCYSPLHHNGTCADGSAGLSKEPLVPARPLGASWCGAHDMAGNVWEFVEEGRVFGGSFRSREEHLAREAPGRRWTDETVDDVGFRVALSAS